MRRRWEWRAGALLAALALLTACSGDDESATPTATLGTGSTTSTTADPYAIPEVIDVAYVNRVLAGLDAAVGDVVRLVVSTKSIPPEAVSRSEALYVGQYRDLLIDSLEVDIERGLDSYLSPPGDQRSSVTELIRADAECIFAKIERDYTAVAKRSDPEISTLWVVLKPRGANANPTPYNPTPWVLTYDGFQPGRVPPETPCD